MKIGCLQFAPHVGDIHNNLNRADAVLNKGENLEELDLLVLPELAFTEITPCLEPSGSGISALWARTIALKHNCNVVVGYPEKVDVTQKWPTSPEFYNSALIVGKDGETIANYRKSHLYAVDEKWALEGQDGFFEGEIEGLGNTALGICMDINPYKFEAPWHAFEFAFHVLEMEANLVIITMAWLTNEEHSSFSRLPLEPDLNTLEYWVQRLEPLIRTENEEEIIVVFCNRTGSEGDAVYAGTSAVIGILNGEVNLYGVLGRGVKDLLIVDTDRKPFAKLVRVSDDDGQVASDNNSKGSSAHTPDDPSSSRHQPFPPNSVSNTSSELPSMLSNGKEKSSNANSNRGDSSRGNSSRGSSSKRHNSSKRQNSREPPQPRKDEPQNTSKATAPATSQAGKAPSTKPLNRTPLSRISLPELKLQIPDSMISPLPKNWKSPMDFAQRATPTSGLSGVSDIPTPTAPSPTPLSMRPKLQFPESTPRRPQTSNATPAKINTNVSRVKRVDTPITPPRMANSKNRPPAPKPIVEKPPSPPSDDGMAIPQPAATERQTVDRPKKASPRNKTNGVAHRASPEQTSPVLQPVTYVPVRPPSTKSRNASNTRRAASLDHSNDDYDRNRSRSRMVIPLMASPSLFDQGAPGKQTQHSDSPIFFQPESYPAGWTPQPDYKQRVSETPLDRRSNSLSGALGPAGGSATEDVPSRQPSRPVSRGRQPFAKRTATNGIMGNQQWSNVVANRAMENQEQRPSNQRPVQSVDRPGPSTGSTRRQSASGPTRASSSNWLFGTSSPMRTHPPIDPDDEIVAVINLVGDHCPLHNLNGGSQAGSVPPQPGQQRHQQQSQQQQPQQQQSQKQRPSQQPSQPQQQQQQGQRRQQEQQSQPQRQPSQQRGTVTVAQPRHHSASGAPRQPIPSQSASVPPTATQDGIYELILPPHIRELVEAMTSPEPRDPFVARGLERRVGSSTPKTFNPPTPTAMQFPSEDEQAAAQ